MKILKCDWNTIEKYKEQFIGLYRALIYVHYPNKIENSIISEDDYKEYVEKLIKYVKEDKGVIFIAKEESFICGYIHGYIRPFLDEKRMMLDGIVVHEKYKGKNIGKKLEEKLEEYAVVNKCNVMELFVTTNNQIGEKFHRSNGFIDSRLHMIKELKK